MAIRTVRLDEEAEAALLQIREETGLRISDALKQGLQTLKQQTQDLSQRRPFEVYELLDLGPGGYSKVPSTDVGRGVKEAIRKKLRKGAGG